MIFVGDVAHPFPEPPAWKEISRPWSRRQAVIANLEGALVQEGQAYLPARKLFNHVSIVKALQKLRFIVVSLANNHILDVEDLFDFTMEQLQQSGIVTVGAGHYIEGASQAASFMENGQKYVFFACGWKTIQCIPARINRKGVNPFNPEIILQEIRNLKERDPESNIVFMPHWNYEMELYPQPAHRQLAMAAIDSGANAVIGHHPHRVGGIEIYKGCPIAYSLGNWWMPQGVYCGGKLRFGDESLLELALEWQPDSEILCHWFEYERAGHQLTHIESEPFDGSERIRELTPFAGMDHETYQRWFRTHRIKRKLLPIYYNYRHSRRNSIKDWVVLKRQVGLRLLEACGVRRMIRL